MNAQLKPKPAPSSQSLNELYAARLAFCAGLCDNTLPFCRGTIAIALEILRLELGRLSCEISIAGKEASISGGRN